MSRCIEYLTDEQEQTVTQLLITLVQRCPMIHSKNLEDYKDVDKKSRKFQEFAEKTEQITGIKKQAGTSWLTLI